MSSTWSLDGDVLVVPAMAQTQMACTPTALMDQDTWLAAVLTSKPTLALDGDTLTITADGSTVTLANDAAAASPPLEGTTWTVDSIVSGSTASSLPAGVRAPTVLFDGGNVTVDTGCNTGRGSYTMGPSTLTFGPIATTRMACADPAASQVEQTVLGVLSGGIIWGIDDGPLSLRNGDTGLLLGAPAGMTEATPDATGLVGPTVAARLHARTESGDRPQRPSRRPTCARRRSSSTGRSVAVDGGCNNGTGSYTVAGDQVTFGPIAMTMMACVDPAVGTLESTRSLERPHRHGDLTVEQGVLTLMNGTTGLRYIAAP